MRLRVRMRNSRVLSLSTTVRAMRGVRPVSGSSVIGRAPLSGQGRRGPRPPARPALAHHPGHPLRAGGRRLRGHGRQRCQESCGSGRPCPQCDAFDMHRGSDRGSHRCPYQPCVPAADRDRGSGFPLCVSERAAPCRAICGCLDDKPSRSLRRPIRSRATGSIHVLFHLLVGRHSGRRA